MGKRPGWKKPGWKRLGGKIPGGEITGGKRPGEKIPSTNLTLNESSSYEVCLNLIDSLVYTVLSSIYKMSTVQLKKKIQFKLNNV